MYAKQNVIYIYIKATDLVGYLTPHLERGVTFLHVMRGGVNGTKNESLYLFTRPFNYEGYNIRMLQFSFLSTFYSPTENLNCQHDGTC